MTFKELQQAIKEEMDTFFPFGYKWVEIQTEDGDYEEFMSRDERGSLHEIEQEDMGRVAKGLHTKGLTLDGKILSLDMLFEYLCEEFEFPMEEYPNEEDGEAWLRSYY